MPLITSEIIRDFPDCHAIGLMMKSNENSQTQSQMEHYIGPRTKMVSQELPVAASRISQEMFTVPLLSLTASKLRMTSSEHSSKDSRTINLRQIVMDGLHVTT